MSSPTSDLEAVTTWADRGGASNRLPSAARKSGCLSMISASTGLTARVSMLGLDDGAGTTITSELYG